MCEILLKNS